MRLKSLELSNFKCFTHLKLDNLDDKKIIVLVGENGSGKSTIFDALNVVFASIVLNSNASYASDDLLRNGENDGYIKAEILLNKDEMIESESEGNLLIVNVNYKKGAHFSPTFQGSVNIHALRENAMRKRYHEEFFKESENVKNLGIYIHRSPYRYEEVLDMNEPQRNFLKFEHDKQNINVKAQIQSTRWQVVLSYLLQLDRIVKSKYFEVNGENVESSLKDLQETQKDFSVLVDDFNHLLSNKKFFRIEETTSDRTYFWIKNDKGMKIEFKQLSSGEKEALFLLSDIRRQKPINSIIAVDEPDLHLHYNLQRKIIDRFLNIGNNNQIFLTTHSLGVVRGLENVDGSSLYYFNENSEYREVKARADFLDLYKVIADDLANVLSNRIIIFTEGEDANKDSKIYELIFGNDKINFIPAQNCSNITSCAWLALHLVSNQTTPQKIYAILDKDGRTKEEKMDWESKFNGHLILTDGYSIESYFFNFDLWESIKENDRRVICKTFSSKDFMEYVKTKLSSKESIQKATNKIIGSRKKINGIMPKTSEEVSENLNKSLADDTFIFEFPMKEFIGLISEELFNYGDVNKFKEAVVRIMKREGMIPKNLNDFIENVKK